MREHIDRLLPFLPRFERTDQSFVTGTVEAGDVTAPRPVYADDVVEFFELASRPEWQDPDYDPVEAGRMLEDEFQVGQASLDQIRAMLTYCVRGERFTSGHWEAVLRSGQVAALLRRLAELRRAGSQ